MVSIWPERGPERGASMEELNFKAAVGHGRRGLLALLLVLICLWSVAGTAASQNARRVCSKCGGPVNVSSSFDGNHLLCSKCASSAPMCSVCGNKIEGVYCKSSTGECICQQCYNKKAPRCSSCGRLIPLGEHCITYEDGAFVCDYCSKDSELPHCFICHITREIIEKRKENFQFHREKRHNLWNYINYMLFLKFSDVNKLNVTNLFTKMNLDNKNICFLWSTN